VGNTNPGPPFPPATQAQLDRAAAEIFATIAAHVQLHADDLHTSPDALLRLVIEKAKRGLPPQRVR
jgi:hypothetical protein